MPSHMTHKSENKAIILMAACNDSVRTHDAYDSASAISIFSAVPAASVVSVETAAPSATP